jgi:hypothetical protein
MKPVVTYQSPNGAKKTLCDEHAKRLTGPNPPRDAMGGEYCGVFYGRHRGECEICSWAYSTVPEYSAAADDRRKADIEDAVAPWREDNRRLRGMSQDE